MWANFYNKKTDLNVIIQSLNDWKSDIFKLESQKVKEYFATKVVTYFDNLMIFHQKKGLHNNLMDSLGVAEKEMADAKGIFKSIYFYLIKEDEGYSLLTQNLEITQEIKDLASQYGFEFIDDNLGHISDLEPLRFNSLQTLVFDFDLVNFAQNWISYTPALEERSRLQAEHILYIMNFKKEDISLIDKINFEENIQKHPHYDELLEKVMKIMPRIENSLEQEWRTKIVAEKTEKESNSVSVNTNKRNKR